VDRAHCVSRAVLDSAKQFGLEESKAFINYPSVDTGFFSPLTSERVKNGDRVHIVSTGRLHWVKGYEYSLLAVRLLIDRGYQVSYTLVGEGSTDDKTQLNFAIRDLDLQNVVSLAGPRSRNEVQHLLSQSDIYLLSSLSEGISNSALEAMAMELPVVVTDVGGMAEAIRDGVDGFVVPSRNPKALADRLESLIKDCDMRLQMGRSGRKSVLERFELQKQTDRFISCYEALLAAKPARQSLSLNSDGQRYETV
jgi:glycosyltransferase involved in cell wall biosynthesis